MRLLHLYHDLLNLYGEYANIASLERCLQKMGICVDVTRTSLGDKPDFAAFDFIYIGSGTERKQLLALDDLIAHGPLIEKARENRTIFLATGNAFELFGKTITTPDGAVHKGLGWFDFETRIGNKRYLADQICTFSNGEKAVGFINKSSEIFGVTTPLFTVDFGEGNHAGSREEGIRSEYFYGTHLTGPVLVKNPFLMLHFLKLLCDRTGSDYRPPELIYENKAYQTTLSALTERFSR